MRGQKNSYGGRADRKSVGEGLRKGSKNRIKRRVRKERSRVKREGYEEVLGVYKKKKVGDSNRGRRGKVILGRRHLKYTSPCSVSCINIVQ